MLQPLTRKKVLKRLELVYLTSCTATKETQTVTAVAGCCFPSAALSPGGGPGSQPPPVKHGGPGLQHPTRYGVRGAGQL